MAIKKVRVIYHERSVWARGSAYEAVESVRNIVGLTEGRILFEKNYPKGTPSSAVWLELRDSVGDRFIDIFYPALVEQTSLYDFPPEETTTKYERVTNPEGRPKWVTRHIASRQTSLPDFYFWNRQGKLVMSPQGYRAQVEGPGGGLNLGFSEEAGGFMHHGTDGIRHLDAVQEMNRGKTISLLLFVYPDHYDEEVRAMFELQITFWD